MIRVNDLLSKLLRLLEMANAGFGKNGHRKLGCLRHARKSTCSTYDLLPLPMHTGMNLIKMGFNPYSGHEVPELRPLSYRSCRFICY